MQILKRIIAALSTAALVIVGLIYVPVMYVVPVMILLVAAVHLEFGADAAAGCADRRQRCGKVPGRICLPCQDVPA